MNKDENIINYPNTIDTRVALLEQSIGTINQTLMRLETKMDEIRKETRSEFKWVITIIVGLGGIMAHGFKWF